jgi:hypothetical protein
VRARVSGLGGQLQTFDAPTVEVCFTLVTGHRPLDWAGPFRANKGHGSRDLDIEIQGFEGTLCTGAE